MENLHWHPFVGDTGDESWVLKMVWAVIALVVAVAYVKMLVPAMVAVIEWKHLEFGSDGAVKMNEERVEAH